MIYIALRYKSGPSRLRCRSCRTSSHAKSQKSLCIARRPPTPRRGRCLELGDFTTDGRVLMLIAMAIVVGTGSAAAAWLLLRADRAGHQPGLVPDIRHASLSLANLQPSLWMVLAPVAGGLIIGLMARFGSREDPRPRHSRGDRGDPDRRQPHASPRWRCSSRCRRRSRSAPAGRSARKARSS